MKGVWYSLEEAISYSSLREKQDGYEAMKEGSISKTEITEFVPVAFLDTEMAVYNK